MIEIRFLDEALIVCIKPAGILSTDQPGGLPELLQEQLRLPERPRTVHRLDQVVSGLMVLARTPAATTALSAQIMARKFEKQYLAVVHNCPEEPYGTYRDLLLRNKPERKTYVVTEPGKGVQEAILDYRVLGTANGLSLVQIELLTGRTHQIRAQFSSRGLPLVGDRKYSLLEDNCDIALWSHKLCFVHPVTGERFQFEEKPVRRYPWELF